MSLDVTRAPPLYFFTNIRCLNIPSLRRGSGASDDWDWGGSAEDRAGWSTAEENHRTRRREGNGGGGKMPNWIRKDKQVRKDGKQGLPINDACTKGGGVRKAYYKWQVV